MDAALELFGFPARTSVTFRLLNNQSEENKNHNIVTMVRSTMTALDMDPVDGVLHLDGELIVLQHVEGQLVLNSDWSYWADLPELSRLAEQHDYRSLPHPFKATPLPRPGSESANE